MVISNVYLYVVTDKKKQNFPAGWGPTEMSVPPGDRFCLIVSSFTTCYNEF